MPASTLAFLFINAIFGVVEFQMLELRLFDVCRQLILNNSEPFVRSPVKANHLQKLMESATKQVECRRQVCVATMLGDLREIWHYNPLHIWFLKPFGCVLFKFNVGFVPVLYILRISSAESVESEVEGRDGMRRERMFIHIPAAVRRDNAVHHGKPLEDIRWHWRWYDNVRRVQGHICGVINDLWTADHFNAEEISQRRIGWRLQSQETGLFRWVESFLISCP